MGSLFVDCCHFDFIILLKELLAFLPLSNPVLQQLLQHGSSVHKNFSDLTIIAVIVTRRKTLLKLSLYFYSSLCYLQAGKKIAKNFKS